MNMVDESELPTQAVTVLPGHQINVRSWVILTGGYGLLTGGYGLLLTNSRCFLWNAACSCSDWEQWVRAYLSLSGVRLLATLWTTAHEAPPSMEFFRQEYWSGWPFPPPRDLPDPGIEVDSPASAGDYHRATWEQYLLELISWFSERSPSQRTPSDPTIYTTSPFLDEDRPLVWLVVVYFTCLVISPISHYCKVSTFHHPSQFVL